MSIRVENLSFSYKKDLILKDISFEVKENTLLCMLGKNGAGKSTLFKSILGLLKPNTGRIYIDDIDINTLSSKEISQKIAYIPQNHNPHFNYKVFFKAYNRFKVYALSCKQCSNTHSKYHKLQRNEH